ncbi:hypothetical protein HMP0721_0747 [Pseudoramibacter alactolyticus ATCC 23263]|uniref:Uncharacterized protein n=1 Tax=Pseudoramibacter alactolyticus ATCC 23263 TaxID=887929 RepID=E6MFG4_9FIRM|nr:hypothetical protein HMP0721_0747 [Pseudoramibacter alactolyticus ATCC 23263]
MIYCFLYFFRCHTQNLVACTRLHYFIAFLSQCYPRIIPQKG